MKILKAVSVALFSIFFINANAQTGIPKGYSKATIVLQDNSSLTGYIKDNMKKDATISFVNEKGDKKNKYNGNDIASVEIDASKFTCIKGDFFKVISNGELSFLQKSSDASGNVTYNGSEAIYASGTPGKIGDYFFYDNKSKELKLVSNKTFETVTASAFAGYAPAIEKAKSAQGNIAQLGEAVSLFNNRSGK
jgi:hypothetical protein